MRGPYQASSRYDQCASLGKKKPRSNDGATAPELCELSPANFGDLCKTEVQVLRTSLPRTWVKLRARGRAGALKPCSALRAGVYWSKKSSLLMLWERCRAQNNTGRSVHQMNVIMLPEHEHPARPEHDLRGRSVLDSNDHQIGYVANLFVDEDEKHLRFIDVVPQDWLGRERKRHHHLVPIEALVLAAEAIRR